MGRKRGTTTPNRAVVHKHSALWSWALVAGVAVVGCSIAFCLPWPERGERKEEHSPVEYTFTPLDKKNRVYQCENFMTEKEIEDVLALVAQTGGWQV